MSKETISQTPKQLGFVMPAECEKHSAIWLAWPYDDTTFPGRIQSAEAVLVKIIKLIYESEKVELLVLDDSMKNKITLLLKEAQVNLSYINFNFVAFQDVWVRDYGPFFIVNRQEKKLGWVKWGYNAYGKADNPYFTDLLKDNKVFDILNPDGQKFKADMVLEGGAIDVNGLGSLLTTKQTLLNPNRNPNLNKEQIEKYLADYLGAHNVVWLEKGLTNDHTDGHIDDIAKFITPNKILVAYEDDPADKNYEILKNNYEILKKAVDQDGKPFEVVKLPMPHMRYDIGHTVHSEAAGENLAKNGQAEKAAASYLNFYIGNSVVLVSTFKDPNDARALQIIQDCFPDRKVVGIDCTDIIYGGGSIHCMTQQQPAV